MIYDVDEEVLIARRAFPEAQRLLAAEPAERVPGLVETSWHDTAIDGETGSVALVAAGGALEELVGEVVRVSARGRSVFVYITGAGPVADDLSLSRRAFFALAPLRTETLQAVVEVT